MRLTERKLRGIIKEEISRVITEDQNFGDYQSLINDIWNEVYVYNGSTGPESNNVAPSSQIRNNKKVRNLVNKGIKKGEKLVNSLDDRRKRDVVEKVLNDLKKIKKAYRMNGDLHSIFANSFQHHQFALDDIGSFEDLKSRSPYPEEPEGEPRRPDFDDPDHW